MSRILLLSMVAALLILNHAAWGQDLPRSASFGAMVADIDDSTMTALKLPSASGTLLRKVIEGSSAHKAGFIANDVLVSIDGENIENTREFLSQLKKLSGGDKVKITYYRKSKLSSVTMVLLPRTMETSSDYDVIYSSVMSGNNHLRTIITRPRGGGNYPAVLLVGGIGCYSVDNPTLLEILSFKMWVDSLTKAGFVTIRVEKTGMGDSKGLPCSECDFHTETQSFLDGLKQLKSLPYVDKNNVFIAGFSMGGVIAPLIAQQEPVKGIVVYGTVGKNWFEYELENSFRQQSLENRPTDSIDLYMRAEYIRLYGLFVEKKSPEQIMKEHPETAPNLFAYPMRIEYFQQVADVNIRELWMNTKAKVLAMHGASDFVSSANEHKLIAETVNHYHPGNGTYAEAANADHWELFTKSEKESLLHQSTEINPGPLTTSIRWMKDNL